MKLTSRDIDHLRSDDAQTHTHTHRPNPLIDSATSDGQSENVAIYKFFSGKWESCSCKTFEKLHGWGNPQIDTFLASVLFAKYQEYYSLTM